MNSKVVFSSIASTFVAVAVYAAETNAVKAVNIKDLSREERREIMMRYGGGLIAKPGTMRGKIEYVNAQKRVPTAMLEKSCAQFNELFRNKIKFDMSVRDGAFTYPSPKINAEATLFVIDDPAQPQSLLAPEGRWAMVNVAGLETGLGAKPQYFEARVQKELMRGVSMLCGALDSAYPRCLLSCKTRPEHLDVNPDCRLPVDVIKRFEPYLAGYGIKPQQLKTYRKACEEGWAPKPKNQIQKEVWDEVHTLPTQPLTIEKNN